MLRGAAKSACKEWLDPDPGSVAPTACHMPVQCHPRLLQGVLHDNLHVVCMLSKKGNHYGPSLTSGFGM